MSKWIFQVICCAFFNTVFYRIVNETVFQIYQQKIIWFFYRAATIPVYADIRLRNYRKNGFFGSNISTKKGLFFCRGYYFQSKIYNLQYLYCRMINDTVCHDMESFYRNAILLSETDFRQIMEERKWKLLRIFPVKVKIYLNQYSTTLPPAGTNQCLPTE